MKFKYIPVGKTFSFNFDLNPRNSWYDAESPYTYEKVSDRGIKVIKRPKQENQYSKEVEQLIGGVLESECTVYD